MSDFDISNWFGVPTEVLEDLQEQEEVEEEDGWGKDWEEDWIPDDPEEEERSRRLKRDLRERQWGSNMPRDTWLRPMSDAQGILDRVALDEDAVEERLSLEWTANQEESRAALKFVGYLIAVPLIVGFAVSRMLSGPIWGWTMTFDPHAFDVTTQQKLEGAHEIHIEEMRIQLDEAIGMSQPLSDFDLLQHLSEEAYELSEKYIEHNKYAALNVVSDSVSASVFFFMLLFSHEGRRVLFSTMNRVFGGLSDTAKAFMIILLADILLGYHSEEGWTAAIRVISGHYGKEPEESAIYIFVATVPVLLDTCFKYWIFEGLNRKSPAAAVTLKTMDRH
ncbi:hypothetical protein BSKO_00768 [Bryopsis sp. KO-2023]|nr:hypothetical protein BSKO_00768 [Bryopsis sp. KO-2023]